jgi:predicted nucleic acid-binding protein
MQKQIIDANFFIESFTKHYSPHLVSNLWGTLSEFAQKNEIYTISYVQEEINQLSDELSSWFNQSGFPILPLTEEVKKCFGIIIQRYKKSLNNDNLPKGMSNTDVWIVAYAMAEKAIVVTRENPIVDRTKTSKVKIPDVCSDFHIGCVNDYTFLQLNGFQFNCVILPKSA